MATDTWKAISSIVGNIRTEITRMREKLSKAEDTSQCMNNIEQECEILSSTINEKTKPRPKPRRDDSFQPHPPNFIPAWENLRNARDKAFWCMTRNGDLANLYAEWSGCTPPKAPRRFKKPHMYNGSAEENAIYQDQAIKQMITEAEVMQIRARNNAKKVHQIDEEMCNALKDIKITQIREALSEKWATNITKSEEQLRSKWSEKKKNGGKML